MKNLFVIRQGETDFNKQGRYLGRADAPLNATGIEQAKQLAEKICNLNIEIIYHSPLKRALETAKFIKAKHACEIIINDFLLSELSAFMKG